MNARDREASKNALLMNFILEKLGHHAEKGKPKREIFLDRWEITSRFLPFNGPFAVMGCKRSEKWSACDGNFTIVFWTESTNLTCPVLHGGR